MLNTAIGTADSVGGLSCLRTRPGAAAHAVYGPYARLDPGRYAVEFSLAVGEDLADGGDDLCALLDVTTDFGQTTLAGLEIRRSQLGRDFGFFALAFELPAPATVEYRVFATGAVPLVVAGYRRLVPLPATGVVETVLREGRFPDPGAEPKPRFLVENPDMLRQLYERGVGVSVVGQDIVLKIEGISFYARVHDDARFVDEIFFRNVYSVAFDFDTCVIDIGMNIGLVSLLFASKPEVKEVHSFEPFASTFDRACANLTLNPALAAKITAHNVGLAGADDELTVLIQHEHDSGQYSIHGTSEGTPYRITVRNAVTLLGPIIAAARAKGRRIVAKIDCEGAEFAIFEVLEAAGLLADLSAVLVEWHRLFPDKDQQTLIAPLRRHGFLVLDMSPPSGNGFFYAVKAA